MYNIYIPTVVTAPAYNRENILSELKRADATRVFLAIGCLEYGTDSNKSYIDILRSDIPYFKENGFEVGVWLWGTMIKGDHPFAHITSPDGNCVTHHACPSDEKFRKYMGDFISEVVSLSPDLIMFDDDMRFGNLHDSVGCYCNNHLEMMSEKLSEKVQLNGLYDKMFSGKPNKYRSAFIKSLGESFENYCKEMRMAVDKVNPNVRLGFCACISNYDADGTDAFRMSKILAGNTKPFLRLIGAPYWGALRNWSNRISDVIEFERAERSWYTDNDIEIFSEGDCYPRPRYKVPSSYVEIFDTALRVSGKMDGILKYMVDYRSSTAYEREYITRHNANKALYMDIDRLFGGKESVGIRIYESMKKLENFDFTYRKHNRTTITHLPFSRAFRITSENSLPTVYEGSGIFGISFGENIRSFINEKSIFEKPLIIDLPAARILTENGIDVGIESFGAEASTSLEHFYDNNEYIGASPVITEVKLKKAAKIRSGFLLEDKTEIPASFTYENAQGNKFLVYTFDCQLSGEEIIRNYERPKQILKIMCEFGINFPVRIDNCPDLYVQVKQSKNGDTAIGLWNCFEDSVIDRDIILSDSFKNCEIINFNGKFEGNKIHIDKLCAFEFGFINLTK